jgi:hypothetical protein
LASLNPSLNDSIYTLYILVCDIQNGRKMLARWGISFVIKGYLV